MEDQTSEHLEHAEHAQHAAHEGNPFITIVSVTIAILAVVAATVGSLETVESGAAIAEKNEAVLRQSSSVLISGLPLFEICQSPVMPAGAINLSAHSLVVSVVAS